MHCQIKCWNKHLSAMISIRSTFLLIVLSTFLFANGKRESDRPKIFVALIWRNSETVLPFLLGGLELQDYPKTAIDIWIRTDCNLDRTSALLKAWSKTVSSQYRSVDFVELPCHSPDEKLPFIRSLERRKHVDYLRDFAVETARSKGSDYVFFLDSNAILLSPETLEELVASKEVFIGPLLPSINKYGNFWCNRTDEFRFLMSDDCSPIFEFETMGLFPVALVHSAFLIDIQDPSTKEMRFSPPVDSEDRNHPHQALLKSLNASGIQPTINNKMLFGYSLPPMSRGSNFSDMNEVLRNLRLEILVNDVELPTSSIIYPDLEDPDTLGFSHAYYINLERRPERRIRLEKSFDILGVEVERIQAVDGRNLDSDLLDRMGIKMLPGYSDPYKKRPMTMGEFGCFLSHYAIWRDIVEKGYETALVFEDDIRFDFYFRRRIQDIWKDINRLNVTWDLIYLGRKRLMDEYEPFLKKSRNLVHVGYSYWTLCYMITRNGAQKLLREKPLTKMIPVDEFLPIMFDRHPNSVWKQHFMKRDLVAFSAYPLLVYPTHYTGEEGYISDTEASAVLDAADNQGARYVAEEDNSEVGDELEMTEKEDSALFNGESVHDEL